MSDFVPFSRAVHARFTELSKHELYKVDVIDLFATYLAAFPEGTDPMFRERTEHDCNCCKQFIRNIGNVIAIIDGEIHTVWGNLGALPHPYDVVAERLDMVVRQSEIASVFRTSEPGFGKETTFDKLADITWNHFHGQIASKHRSDMPDSARAKINVNAETLRSSLDKLSIDAIDTVLDLMAENNLERTGEYQGITKAFAKLKREYDATPNRNLFCWANAMNASPNFKGTSIGALIADLTDGMELEDAVGRYEFKVSGGNFKRSKALVSKKMIEDGVKTLEKLGLRGALNRRMANIADVSVNDVLFVNNDAKSKMKDGDPLVDLLMEDVVPAKVEINHAEKISMADFLATIVPQASSIDLLVENDQMNKFVSLTAPVEEDTGRLFKWGNDFAWSYDGEVASSLRDQVAAKGGRVDGVLRFSHQWNHIGRNASLMDLHVFMPGSSSHADGKHDRYPSGQRVGWNQRNDHVSGGSQDVDHVNAAAPGFIPVENIAFPTMSRLKDGQYVFKIHNWQLRNPTDSGFRAEIEFGGQVFVYDYPKALGHKEWVTVAVATLKNGKFTIEHKIPCASAPQEKWGVKTQQLVPVETLMASPNHWGDDEAGDKHWFFILKDCRNPEPARGIYNEFLRAELNPHRKVFERLGSKMKCQPTDDQLSGIGFTTTRRDTATVVVKGKTVNKAFEIEF